MGKPWTFNSLFSSHCKYTFNTSVFAIPPPPFFHSQPLSIPLLTFTLAKIPHPLPISTNLRQKHRQKLPPPKKKNSWIPSQRSETRVLSPSAAKTKRARFGMTGQRAGVGPRLQLQAAHLLSSRQVRLLIVTSAAPLDSRAAYTAPAKISPSNLSSRGAPMYICICKVGCMGYTYVNASWVCWSSCSFFFR